MAKLTAPKKPAKPNAPKKPSSRSKTGNAECSSAASNWQLSLRGKASLDPDTYRTLAKCRAMNRTAKMAEGQGRTGKLSEQGEAAVKGRLQSRFDRGLITQRSRTERLGVLLKQRAERAKAEAPVAKSATTRDVATHRLAPTERGVKALRPAAQIPMRSTVKAVKGRLLVKAETQSGVATLRTTAIQADPERFQYKMNTSGPIGVTDQFKETKTWNRELAGVVQVWKDPENGRTYVVNGHHRFELAQRLGVKKLNVQYIQAKDAAEARSKGALTNIAEGRGTSIDAARYFRDQKGVTDWEGELQKRGISLSERTAREGLALKNLAPKIWRDVVDEMTPVSRAVAIGQSKLREEDQLKLYRRASDGNWTAGKTAEFGTELRRSPLVKTGESSLFGDDEFVNTAEHRAALADKLKSSLKSGKKLFGTVARGRNAGKLESAGNRIDRESSAAIAAANDRALMSFEIERKYDSRVSRLMDRYATQIAQGDKVDRVYSGFESRAIRALEKDIARPFSPRLAKRRARLAALTPEQRQRSTQIAARVSGR